MYVYIIYSCYRRYLTHSHHPPRSCYFCVSKITFYFGIPLGNNRLALTLLFIQKPKTNMFFFLPVPFPGSHSTFNNIFIMRFNKTPEQLSDINALLFVAPPTNFAPKIIYICLPSTIYIYRDFNWFPNKFRSSAINNNV